MWNSSKPLSSDSCLQIQPYSPGPHCPLVSRKELFSCTHIFSSFCDSFLYLQMLTTPLSPFLSFTFYLEILSFLVLYHLANYSMQFLLKLLIGLVTPFASLHWTMYTLPSWNVHPCAPPLVCGCRAGKVTSMFLLLCLFFLALGLMITWFSVNVYWTNWTELNDAPFLWHLYCHWLNILSLCRLKMTLVGESHRTFEDQMRNPGSSTEFYPFGYRH